MLLFRWHLRFSLTALCLMLIAPFLNAHHLNPIPTFFQEWLAATLGLLAASLLLRRELIASLAVPEIALLPLGFVALLLVQFAGGYVTFPSQALLFALYLLWALLMLMLAHSLRQQLGLEKLTTILAFALLSGAILSLALLVLQPTNSLLGLGPLLQKAGLRGPLGQPNHLADYLWLGLASAVYLHVQGKLSRVSFMLIAFTLLAGASLTHSRSVTLYAAGFSLLSGWAAWRWRQALLRQTFHISLWLLGGTVLLEYLFNHFVFGSSLAASLSGERFFAALSTTSTRLQLWRTGLAIFAEHPWLGAGVGQFSWNAYALVGTQPDGTFIGRGEHAHNLFIHLLAEFGIVAPLLVLGLGIRWWLAFVRTTWSSAHVWIAAILLILGVHSQLEYPLWYVFFLGIVALALGMGSGDSSTWLRPQITRLGRMLLASILLFGGGTLFHLFKDYRTLEQAVNQQMMQVLQNPASWSETLVDLKRLHGESLFSHYVDLAYGHLLALDPSDPAARQALKDKILICQRALRFSPVDPVVFTLAYLLALDGRDEDAKIALQQALNTYPESRPEAIRQLDALRVPYPELNALFKQAGGEG
jgi:O-antigen ligase